MASIWWCDNCGYETRERGRCHSCGARLVASSLPELVPGSPDEVDYDLSEDWEDIRLRVGLIDGLNQASIMHRFEENELVILSTDEAAVEEIMNLVLAAPEFILDTVHVLDGAGWAPLPGEIVACRVYYDHFEIADVSVPLTAMRDVRVEGHSLVQRGNFFGGGFGAAGAAEGMVAASVLNALTTKKKSWVHITIVAADGWVSLNCEGWDETVIRIALRPLADAAFEAQRRARELAEPHSGLDSKDLVAQLERLAGLHASGVLSDEEFSAAKRQLLLGGP